MLEVTYRKISELTKYERNSRTHSAAQIEQIKNSIKEFGFTNPILIDEHGLIIAGHGRLEAAKELSMEAVPTITLHGLSDAQKKAYVIADNKLALNAGWDDAMLESELRILQEVDYDLSLIGFDDAELDVIFNGEIDPNDLGEGFSLPDGDKAPFQQMTFTMADAQAEMLKEAIDDIKKTDYFKFLETYGNENSNGNALYAMVMQWAEQRKY